MRALVVLFLVSSTLVAKAQQIQQTERVYTLTLAASQVNLIGRVLRKLPYEDVVALLESIGQQVDAQNKVLNKPPEEAPK